MKGAPMEVNVATTIANQEISTNKAQTGLDILTRTLAKTEQAEKTRSPMHEGLKADIAKQTGKGQNIDIRV